MKAKAFEPIKIDPPKMPKYPGAISCIDYDKFRINY
jgi:hypothetical protein